MKELRPLLIVGGLLALVMLAGLVSLHEKHYARRHMRILEGRVTTLEGIVTEDRTA